MTCLLNRNGIFYVGVLRTWPEGVAKPPGEGMQQKPAWALLEFEREERKRMSFRVSDFAEDFTARASTSLSAKTISMYSGAFKNCRPILGRHLS